MAPTFEAIAQKIEASWLSGVHKTCLIRLQGQPGTFRPLSYGVQRLLGFSLRGLSPRELVRYFYLSAARRAADAGQPRRSGQTPYEYQRSLQDRFPELEPDLTGLTDAFLTARYSAQPMEEDDAQEVKPLWQRIKVLLRQRRLLK